MWYHKKYEQNQLQVINWKKPQIMNTFETVEQ